MFAPLIQVLEKNWRPAFPKETPQQYRDIVSACWATEKEDRPSFHEVRLTLTKMLAEVASLAFLNVMLSSMLQACSNLCLDYVDTSVNIWEPFSERIFLLPCHKHVQICAWIMLTPV